MPTTASEQASRVPRPAAMRTRPRIFSATLLPVPGGIGVAEFGLTVGLAAAGRPGEAAFANRALYRGATFYLPPVWGFFAMRWLRRNELL